MVVPSHYSIMVCRSMYCTYILIQQHTTQEANYSSDRLWSPCFLDFISPLLKDISPADTRLLQCTYVHHMLKSEPTQPQPATSTLWLDILKTCLLHWPRKVIITSDLPIVACWKTWIARIHNDTAVVIVVSLNHICLQQRVYIPSSKTQF